MPNAADAAWDELLSLRSQATMLGIEVDESWPIAQIRREIAKALADADQGSAAPGLPEILQALKLEPGQTLIVRISPDRHVTKEQFDAMADACKTAMPEYHFLLVEADELAVAEPVQAGGDRG